MNVLFIFTSSLFFLWVIREIFFWLNLWQSNAYRPDRFFSSIRKRKKKLLLAFVRWLVFFSYGFIIFSDNLLTEYQYVIIGLYLLQTFIVGREIYLNHLAKPRLTLRANLIIFLTLFFVFILFAFPLMDRFFWLLFIDLLVPLLVSFFVFLFLFPIEIYSDWQAEKALQKLQAKKKLLIIAVTGSQGKSAVKDYIADILRHKFSVMKTEKKDNTATGITRTILKQLEDHTEIFVAELSAYKRGEIQQLCEFIQPKIGVLTGINNQYRSLFNGFENIKKTNYELVESLPKNGICLFNGMNKHTIAFYKKSKKRKAIYTIESEKETRESQQGIIASNIIKTPKRTTFDVQINKKKLHLVLHTPQNIEKLLPALYIAYSLGMTEKEIKKAVATLA